MEVGIHITSTGAEEGRAALDGLREGMGQVVEEHNKMAGKFSTKIQHIGLDLLGKDLLRTVGLGGEANKILNLFNSGLTSVAKSLGLAGSAALGWATALTVVAGLVYKVYQGNKENLESLDKLAKKYDEERTSVDKSVSALTDYKNAVGDLPPVLQKLLDAKTELLKLDRQEAIGNTEKQIAILKETIDKQYAQIQALDIQKQKSKELGLQNNLIYEDWGAGVRKVEQEIVRNNARLAESIAKLDALKKGGELSYDALADAAKKSADEQWKSMEELAKNETEMYQRMAQERADLILQEEKEATERNQSNAKLRKEQMEEAQKLNKEYLEEYQALGEGAARSVGKAFGDSFVKMWFEGKDFAKSMEQAFKQMAQQIISDIIRIQIQWAIMSSMTGGAAGGAGGFAKIFARAEGGSDLVTKPTLFLAGEAGPEIATFTPLSKMGGGASIGSPQGMGGGTTVVIQNMENHAHGVQNPAMFADQVGRAIINRIRGQGELNFVGG